MAAEVPETKYEGTDETLFLPGVVHALWVHRDGDDIRLEAWSPAVLDGGAANICLSEHDRQELIEFLQKVDG